MQQVEGHTGTLAEAPIVAQLEDAIRRTRERSARPSARALVLMRQLAQELSAPAEPRLATPHHTTRTLSPL